MKSTYTALILSVLIFSCTNNPRNSSMANIKDAPKAKQMTKELSMHDDVRQDAFYWLNERENLEVIAYLEAENAYYDSNTAHSKDFQTTLFEANVCAEHPGLHWDLRSEVQSCCGGGFGMP
jgi:oligopeptidase B